MDQEITILSLEKTKYAELAKLQNTSTQAGDIMISLNTVNATREKKVKTVKDNEKEIVIREKARLEWKHAIDTYANHLRNKQ